MITAEWVPLPVAGLRVTLSGKQIDAYYCGLVQVHLQYLTDRVAIRLLQDDRRIDPEWLNQWARSDDPAAVYRPLVQWRISGIRTGSIILELDPFIVCLLSDPWTIAVLQNLAANVIWAIGKSGYESLHLIWEKRRENQRPQKSVLSNKPARAPTAVPSEPPYLPRNPLDVDARYQGVNSFDQQKLVLPWVKAGLENPAVTSVHIEMRSEDFQIAVTLDKGLGRLRSK